MSMEAVGQNGAVLGSDMYWNQLNSSTILGGLMPWASGTEYYRTLQEAATRASTAIEEIYDDLQQNIDRICLVPSRPRSALVKQVESLYNVCEMAGILNRHSSKTLNMWERSFKSEDVFYWLPELCWMYLSFAARSMMICMTQIEKLEKRRILP